MTVPASLLTCAARLSEELGVPIEAVISDRASTLSMRVDVRTGGVRVTLPTRGSVTSFRAFIQAHAGWIKARAAKIPSRVHLVPGNAIPVLGVERSIRQDISVRLPARLNEGPEGPEILLGRTEFVENRVVDLLKEEVRRHLTALTRQKAAIIGKPVTAVTVKEVSSRWGSCASSGEIAYSWRIVFAPLEVIDYLVAHEVSHLAEMNHGPNFWRLCRSISTMGVDQANSWLEFHGPRLHRYGPI